MLKRVDRDVNLATKGRQQPERLSKLKTEFQFAAKQPIGPAKQLVRPPVQVTQAEADYWQQIKVSMDLAVVKAYLDRYPGGLYSNLARERVRELEKGASAKATPKMAAIDPEIECSETMAVGTREAQKRYLDLFPTHRCSDQIRKIIRMESDQTMWERVVKSERVADFKKYLEAFPDGVYTAPAKDRIAMLEATEKGKNPPPTDNRTVIPVITPTPLGKKPENWIRRFANRFVEGDGYRTQGGLTVVQCEALCLADSRCRMFEFYRPLDTCGHFEHMIIKGESNEAEIGVKQDAGTPRTTASISANLPEGSFKRHTDHAFKWSGQIATNAGSHSECESRCKSSSDCQGYTFFDQRKLCRLMDVQAELVEDGTAVSGAKQ